MILFNILGLKIRVEIKIPNVICMCTRAVKLK